ncbi:hypothetical protein [Psychromonas sp. MME2]|uniref:hypothetical protein n=1 Tax=unclassified Psychromonas TaxID=2614957 RepID=UPI00339C7125
MSDINSVFEAISLYQAHYSQVDKLWDYFSVVSISVAGFVIGSQKATKSFKEALIIAVAYLAFCIGNNLALTNGQKQLQQLAQIAIDLGKETGIDVSALAPLSTCHVATFQILIALSVSIGVLFIAFLRREKNNLE